jgi:deoxyribonuclease-4
MKKSEEETYQNITEAISFISEKLKENNINITLRPETMGKLSQFGSLKEVIKLSKEIDNVLPCIDISHLFARNLGKKNNLAYFCSLLKQIKDNLGEKALKNMHFHCSGIEYGKRGERYHLSFKESEFNYKDFLKALKEYKVEGIVINESPLMESDALLLKKFFESL